MASFKTALYESLNNPDNRYFSILNDALAALTLVSIGCIVLETVPSMQQYHSVLLALETIALVVFTLEYLARLYSAPKRRAYVFSFFGLIDLLSILPSFLHLANFTFLKSARVLRILRLLRMIRLAKLAHMHRKSGGIDNAHSITIINVQIYFLTLFSAILLLGSVIYVLEAHHKGFSSIPDGMIWAADVILGGGIPGNDPQTTAGKMLIFVARFIGLALLGILVAVVGSFMKGVLFGGELDQAPAAKKPKRRKAASRRKAPAKTSR